LTKVTKSVVIHGFDFVEALEHTLKQCSVMGKHTGVVHITPNSATKYAWAHKVHQPWGITSPLQCPTCGILNPWTTVYADASDELKPYILECSNKKCGQKDGTRVEEQFSFRVGLPEGSTRLGKPREEGVWTKVPLN
jgi:hypothetical protein